MVWYRRCSNWSSYCCLLVVTDRQRPLAGIGIGRFLSLIVIEPYQNDRRASSQPHLRTETLEGNRIGKGIKAVLIVSAETATNNRRQRSGQGDGNAGSGAWGGKGRTGAFWYADRQPCREPPPPPVAFACGVNKQESQRAQTRFQSGIQSQRPDPKTTLCSSRQE